MGKKDQVTYSVIEKFIGAKITRFEAATFLECTERHVSRLARRVEEGSMLGVVHASRGKSPHNKIPPEKKELVMGLVRSKYFDFNLTHTKEKLEDDHGIVVSYSTLRRWCDQIKLVKRKKRRRGKIRRSRTRMASEGLLLQMDGSPHRYNGKDQWCLIAAIDDATSDIVYAEFFLTEDTLNCMTVLQKIIEIKGLPEAIYVDKAGWFGGQKRAKFSQFERACDELGIKLIYADSPQAKGRIERSFDTIQDRICPEMRLRNIKSIPAANYYLQNQFLPEYWRKNNTLVPRSNESSYRQNHLDKEQLNQILCLKEYRTVKADHTLSWDSEIYKIQSPLKYSIWKQKIEIRTYQNLQWKSFFANKQIYMELLQKPEKLKLSA